MLNGDPADRDAGALKKAVHKAIDGKTTVAKEFDVAAASSDGAQLARAQALTALKGKVDAVYGANDEIASGAGAAMKQAGLKTLPPVTGGDTELSAVQRIISGEQYMTVYRPVRQGAEAAAPVAYDPGDRVAGATPPPGPHKREKGGGGGSPPADHAPRSDPPPAQ